MGGLETVVLVGVVLVAGGALARRVRLPAPVVLLVCGVGVGFVPFLDHVEMPPELVLVLFLPAILYWESLTTSLREIRANLRVIVLLALLLVVATAAVVAVVAHALGLAWPMAFVLGTVVAPTDATAVAAIAVRLPRRTLTTLRAESLINDGTALVLYAAAVGVAVGTTAPNPWRIGGGVLLAYAGGAAVGLLLALVVTFIRRRMHDTALQTAASVVTPFAAFLSAEMLHVSGVVAVVCCGLVLSQTGPRIIDATTRLESYAFWRVTTYVLNGSLFVLVGLQLPTLLAGLSSVSVLQALGFGLLIAATVAATRLVWVNTTPYAIRVLDRRESQRARRVGARQRLPVAWAGFRGAVSLAAALAIPELTADGQPLAGRDLVLIATFTVIGMTMLVQATTMNAVVRWAHLPEDTAEIEEMDLAEHAATQAGLNALHQRAVELGTPDRVARRVAEAYRQRLQQLDEARENCGPDESPDHHLREDNEAEQQLRVALLADKRDAVIRLRDQRRIDDTVLRRLQARLDREEVRLAGIAEDD